MKTKLLANSIAACSLIAALAISLAAPVSAQTLTLHANIPFDFVVAGRTVPAGDYWVGPAANNKSVVLVRNVSSGTAALAITFSAPAERPGDRAKAWLVFHRYGGDYFLAGIWDGYKAIGSTIPMSSAERERAKTASLGKPEAVVVMARL
jgi:hypothetical protein